MKLIQCIIRPEKLNDIVDKLVAITPGLTISDVHGHGRKTVTGMYRGVEYRLLLPSVMIEILTDDNKVNDLVKILAETARTGEIGDGRIFVLPVQESYHVRTGFMD